MQNFEVTNKEHYGMLWYFVEWSIKCALFHSMKLYSQMRGKKNSRKDSFSLCDRHIMWCIYFIKICLPNNFDTFWLDW